MSEEQKKQFLIYKNENNEVKVNVLLQNETIWLTINQMATLFGIDKSGISRHIKNIYETVELQEEGTVAKLATVQTEGEREIIRQLEYYNLDMIISVGYRVNSSQATQFRIWATQTLKEYIIKGFVLDDDRLKQAKEIFGKDYFDELLERVRSIRASERRVYQKITDIFAECSNDYNRKSPITKDFYATIQNKFHFAITGNTAAEIINKKANSQKQNMGLQTWKNAPKGRILKSDTHTAKNYLIEKDIKKLERTISSFFDYIENIIENKISFSMQSFAESVNKFLDFNEFKILDDKGKITHKKAIEKANQEYDKFNQFQKIESDFDKEIKIQMQKLK